MLVGLLRWNIDPLCKHHNHSWPMYHLLVAPIRWGNFYKQSCHLQVEKYPLWIKRKKDKKVRCCLCLVFTRGVNDAILTQTGQTKGFFLRCLNVSTRATVAIHLRRLVVEFSSLARKTFRFFLSSFHEFCSWA